MSESGRQGFVVFTFSISKCEARLPQRGFVIGLHEPALVGLLVLFQGLNGGHGLRTDSSGSTKDFWVDKLFERAVARTVHSMGHA